MNPNKVLVVDDEDAAREMLCTLLKQAEYSATAAANAEQAWDLMRDFLPDLILLDWMLPGLSGAEGVRHLKKNPEFKSISIILLTARSEEEDRIKGLEAGADDYVTKPFSTRELLARIQAVLRGAGKLRKSGRVNLGGIELSIDECRVAINGTSLPLSPMEYRLLGFFMTHPDKAFTRSQLLNQVWTRSSHVDEQTVNIHVSRLRKLLKEHHCEQTIQTVRGIGYRFSERV